MKFSTLVISLIYGTTALSLPVAFAVDGLTGDVGISALSLDQAGDAPRLKVDPYQGKVASLASESTFPEACDLYSGEGGWCTEKLVITNDGELTLGKLRLDLAFNSPEEGPSLEAAQWLRMTQDGKEVLPATLISNLEDTVDLTVPANGFAPDSTTTVVIEMKLDPELDQAEMSGGGYEVEARFAEPFIPGEDSYRDPMKSPSYLKGLIQDQLQEEVSNEDVAEGLKLAESQRKERQQ